MTWLSGIRQKIRHEETQIMPFIPKDQRELAWYKEINEEIERILTDVAKENPARGSQEIKLPILAPNPPEVSRIDKILKRFLRIG